MRLKPRHEPQLNSPANYRRVNFSPRHILQATQHIIQNDPLMTSDCGDGFAPVGSTKFRLVVSYPSSSAMEGLSFQPFFFSSEHHQDLLPCSLHIESNLLVSCSLSYSLIYSLLILILANITTKILGNVQYSDYRSTPAFPSSS